MTARAGFGGEPAARLGRPLKASAGAVFTHAPVGSTKCPCTSKINSPLPPSSRLRELRLERGFTFELEEAAALAAAALPVLNASNALAAPQAETRKSRRVRPKRFAFCRRLVRQPVAGAVGRRKRNGREFPVRSRIQFDRQPPAFGIDHVFHRSEYRPRNDAWRMTESRFFPPMSRLTFVAEGKGISPILENETRIRSRQSTWP